MVPWKWDDKLKNEPALMCLIGFCQYYVNTSSFNLTIYKLPRYCKISWPLIVAHAFIINYAYRYFILFAKIAQYDSMILVIKHYFINTAYCESNVNMNNENAFEINVIHQGINEITGPFLSLAWHSKAFTRTTLHENIIRKVLQY